jgi:coenzyme PQQ precursor peptide PqqA
MAISILRAAMRSGSSPVLPRNIITGHACESMSRREGRPGRGRQQGRRLESEPRRATTNSGSHDKQEGDSIMAWTRPTLREICIGMEINGYLAGKL